MERRATFAVGIANVRSQTAERINQDANGALAHPFRAREGHIRTRAGGKEGCGKAHGRSRRLDVNQALPLLQSGLHSPRIVAITQMERQSTSADG